MRTDERQVADGTFRYIDTGEGEGLLLLHSIGTSNRLWSGVIPELSTRYRIIAPDYLGHGDSSRPSREFSIPDHARSLVELMTSLGFDRFIAAGTSLGGLIGIELAGHHRRHVSALIANGAPGWTSESQRMARLASVSQLIDAEGMPRPGIAPGGTVRPVSDAEMAERVEDFQKTGRWFISTMWSIAAFDPMSRLPKITCPALILMGSGDFHMATCYNLADGIDEARLVVIDNTGHLTPYDDPHAVTSAIIDFLDETKSERTA